MGAQLKRSLSRGLAALLVLALVLVLVFLSRERGGESAQLGGAAGAELVQEPRATAKDTAPAALDSNSAVEREIAPESAPTSAAPSPTDTILVRVVDCERFEPVAGAEVRWASWDWIAQSSSVYSVDSVTQGARVLEGGLVGQTDAQGQIRLPKPDSRLLVQSSAPGRWGQAYVSPGTTVPTELVLAPDGDLLVEVVDKRGTPVAGVRVGARRAAELRSFISVNADTGPNGLARLPHARAQLLAGAENGTLLVTVVSADPEAPRALVSVPPWPSAPVRLRLGETGTVVVNVVDAAGAMVVEPAEVQLSTQRPGEQSSTLHAFAPRGTATFEHMPLGAQLSIFAFPRLGGGVSGAGARAAGPSSGGERVVVSVPICVPPPTLSGRALDERGEPLAHAELSLSVREASPLPSLAGEQSTRTDEEGRFEVKFTEKPSDKGPGLVLVVRAGELALEGVVPFSVAASGTLGDIRLSPAPRLVAGRVVDEAGAGIAGAPVTLLRFALEPDQSESEVEIAGGMAQVEWETDRLRTARSDAHGNFELRVLEASGKYCLRAFARGFVVGAQVPFEIGASDVEIVLKREVPPLRGRVLLPSPESLERLSISTGQWSGTFDEYGRFTIPRRSAEPLDVVLRADGLGPEPFVTIVQVSDPQDPRLAEIDLRPLVQALSFRVVGDDGTPVRTVKVSGYSRAGTGWQLTATGHVCLLTRDSALDLQLKADGYLPESFVGVRSGDVLELVRLPSLRVRVPEHLPEPGEGLVYVVQATLEGSKREWTTLQSGREGHLRLSAPGTWNVLWTVRGSGKLLSQVDLVVGREDVECVLDAKLADVEAARAEALEKAQARARKSVK
ncbi:MAG: carboxypeptidase-like regulatory domain-containing protein [Planctomycetota bacterium]|nr:carboxypeptidase-like regulatory domain-containing protein [Planctomycetota bacterium]